MYAVCLMKWLNGGVVALIALPWLGSLVTFHVAHDASHGALSTRPWVNELLTFSSFLVGAPHEWTNLADADPDAKHVRRWVKGNAPLKAMPVVWAIAVLASAGSEKQRVDIGFQVFNLSNYPLLSKLFDELGVETIQSDMSLSIAARGVSGDFEWSSKSPFPTWADVVNPRCWRRWTFQTCYDWRLFEILRFESAAREALAKDTLGDQTLSGMDTSIDSSCDQTPIAPQEYIAPVGAAIWSCSMEEVTSFPACFILGFMDNHYLLQRARPKWRTLKYRSEELGMDYVAKLHKVLQNSGGSVCRSTEVAKLQVTEKGVQVVTTTGQMVCPEKPHFDKVVLAVHADDASGILARSSGLNDQDTALCKESILCFRILRFFRAVNRAKAMAKGFAG
eukprot:Skav213357  [mRNA]  locus=scaffold317:164304:177477:- [translate_table: standard]